MQETLACSAVPWWFYLCRLCAAFHRKHPNVCQQESQGKKKHGPTGNDTKYSCVCFKIKTAYSSIHIQFLWNSAERKWKTQTRQEEENVNCLSFLKPRGKKCNLNKILKSFLCPFLFQFLSFFQVACIRLVVCFSFLLCLKMGYSLSVLWTSKPNKHLINARPYQSDIIWFIFSPPYL